jgi:hypothetical protein
MKFYILIKSKLLSEWRNISLAYDYRLWLIYYIPKMPQLYSVLMCMIEVKFVSSINVRRRFNLGAAYESSSWITVCREKRHHICTFPEAYSRERIMQISAPKMTQWFDAVMIFGACAWGACWGSTLTGCVLPIRYRVTLWCPWWGFF